MATPPPPHPLQHRLLRVFLIFSVGILVPAVFLGYLGLKSLRYERLLVNQQTQERQTLLAESLYKQLDDLLRSHVTDLKSTLNAETFQRGDPMTMTLQALNLRKIGGDPAERLFLIDAQGRLIVPPLAAKTAVTGADLQAGIDWGPLSYEIQRLEDLEFAQNKVGDALRGYRTLFDRPLAPEQKAALLKTIAGNYRRLGDDRSAEASYLKLIRDYGGVIDPSGFPMHVVARQLLVKLYDATSQGERAQQVRLELAEGAVAQQWNLGAAQEALLLQEARTSIPQHPLTPEAKERWQRLGRLADELRQFRADGERFVAAAWPRLWRQIQTRPDLAGGGLFSPGAPPEPDHRFRQLIVVTPWSSGAGRAAYGVALLQGGPLWTRAKTLGEDLAASGGLRIRWEAGPAPGEGWRSLGVRHLRGIEPPLSFELFEPGSTAQERLEKRRQWIYAGIVGLSLVVILVGLIVMGEAFRRETEIANLKAHFVANVSHEIRTPLSAITYIGERLHEGRYRSDDEAKRFYGLLYDETRHLKDLIEDILDFSKMLEGKKDYQRSPRDLRALAAGAVERFRAKAEAQGFTVDYADSATPLPVLADDRAVGQAVLNLLENALKYSGSSRRIAVRVARDGDGGAIAVEDFGIGVAPEQQARIFEKFYRVEDPLARQSAGGVGLGLSIVRHIVEGHGGRVTLASEVGKGSTFTLWFPLHP